MGFIGLIWGQNCKKSVLATTYTIRIGTLEFGLVLGAREPKSNACAQRSRLNGEPYGN